MSFKNLNEFEEGTLVKIQYGSNKGKLGLVKHVSGSGHFYSLDDPSGGHIGSYSKHDLKYEPKTTHYNDSETDDLEKPEGKTQGLREDANVVGSGAIAGAGVGAQGEPGVNAKRVAEVVMHTFRRKRVV